MNRGEKVAAAVLFVGIICLAGCSGSQVQGGASAPETIVVPSSAHLDELSTTVSKSVDQSLAPSATAASEVTPTPTFDTPGAPSTVLLQRDRADVIREAINEFLLEYLETIPHDVSWATITTHGLGKREARRWKPLLHSSRR